MVSHDMKNLRQQCDMGILLRDGKLEVFDNIPMMPSKFTSHFEQQLIMTSPNSSSSISRLARKLRKLGG